MLLAQMAAAKIMIFMCLSFPFHRERCRNCKLTPEQLNIPRRARVRAIAQALTWISQFFSTGPAIHRKHPWRWFTAL
jgi:hypothetical protein